MTLIITRARSRERARRAAGVERSDWALVKVSMTQLEFIKNRQLKRTRAQRMVHHVSTKMIFGIGFQFAANHTFSFTPK